ncbi:MULTISPECIES: hypothetical protein [Paenibacillus]|uniref:hypothetical protein n=1 Tax=Paenibacillus polymyxa TaxID=1406 RepID=UPI001EE9F662|nr:MULTISPECIES: hypothetical protein [unclassified Paenibacillus]
MTYTVLHNNFGNIASEVIFQNFVPAGTLYIPDSLQLNAQTFAEANPAAELVLDLWNLVSH